MTRRFVRSLALLGVVALAACVVNISFDLQQQINAKTFPTTTTIMQAQPFSLLDNKDVAEHQANIKALSLESIDATFTTLNTANRATTISGTVTLHKTWPETAAGVSVGTLANFPITQGAMAHFPGSDALDQFLLDAIHSDGKFYLVVNGSTDQQLDVVLNVDLHASVAYDAGIL